MRAYTLTRYENVLNKLHTLRHRIVLWIDLLLRERINRSEGRFSPTVSDSAELSTIIGFLSAIYVAARGNVPTFACLI